MIFKNKRRLNKYCQRFILKYYKSNIRFFYSSTLTISFYDIQHLKFIFFRLSRLILGDKRLSGMSTLLFIFNPSSIFFNTLYSESLFSLLTFTSFYKFFNSLSVFHPLQSPMKFLYNLIIPLTFLLLSIFVRSNGMFYVAVIGYYVLKNFIFSFVRVSVMKSIFFLGLGVSLIFLVIIPYFLVLYYPYSIYCNKAFEMKTPKWCYERVPNVYDFIQKEYWGVSFMGSWEINGGIFIYWGIHMLIIISILLYSFFKHSWKCFFTLGLWEKDAVKVGRKNGIIYNEKWNPFIIYTIILFLISFFYANIMSCTRFFSSCPTVYWYLSSIILRWNEEGKKWEMSGSKRVFMLCIHFNMFGMLFFANFLPWT